MKRTTRKQDAAYLFRALAEATKARQVGERVLAKGGGETTIAAIDGDCATLANGERWHVSKLCSAPNDTGGASRGVECGEQRMSSATTRVQGLASTSKE